MERTNEDDIGFINRLLERLHQADSHVPSSIEINIYKPGSQHVDRVGSTGCLDNPLRVYKYLVTVVEIIPIPPKGLSGRPLKII